MKHADTGSRTRPTFAAVHALLTGEDEARVCRDIPDSACRAQPRNFVLHALSLLLTKAGDGLADPKLVLSWLLGATGAPVWVIGLIVPIREALAMLPQLIVSARIRRFAIRKNVHVAGCVVQGLAMIGFGLTTALTSGLAAGLSALWWIAVFALGRSICSVSLKDVLGKTVSKGRRGTATGLAGSLAAAAVLLVSVALTLGWIPLNVGAVSAMVMLAGTLWLAAALLFTRIDEAPGQTDGGVGGLRAITEQFGLLTRHTDLRRIIYARTLLLSTALAPPFYIALAAGTALDPGRAGGGSGDVPGSLGPFMAAAALAGVLSTWVWGRMADRSSRQVLVLAASIASLANVGAALLGMGIVGDPASAWQLPALLFILLVAHQGVRLGRSTYIVDMADAGNRASLTALSNTLVGLALLAGSAFGLLAQWQGPQAVLVAFAVMSLSAIPIVGMLTDVHREQR